MTRKKTGSTGNERRRRKDPFDAYETAPWQVEALWDTYILDAILDRTDKPLWWDPCAGRQSLSKAWQAMTGHRMFTSDLRDIPGLDLPCLDFLHTTEDDLPERPLGIVMNPPFDCDNGNVEQFILRALKMVERYVVVFCRIQMLESDKREKRLFSLNKLAWVLPFSRRANLYPEGAVDLRGSGKMMFAWYVFDLRHDSPIWQSQLLTAQPQKDMPQQVGKCIWCRYRNDCGHGQEDKEFCGRWKVVRPW